jgi:hypothetical protein
MTNDYTSAITAVIAMVVGLSAMVIFVFSRPSDLSPSSR